MGTKILFYIRLINPFSAVGRIAAIPTACEFITLTLVMLSHLDDACFFTALHSWLSNAKQHILISAKSIDFDL